MSKRAKSFATYKVADQANDDRYNRHVDDIAKRKEEAANRTFISQVWQEIRKGIQTAKKDLAGFTTESGKTLANADIPSLASSTVPQERAAIGRLCSIVNRFVHETFDDSELKKFQTLTQQNMFQAITSDEASHPSPKSIQSKLINRRHR